MHSYVKCLNLKGTLLLSGFYEEDIPATISCTDNGLTYVKVRKKQLDVIKIRKLAIIFINYESTKPTK
jgi:hypothetical protein